MHLQPIFRNRRVRGGRVSEDLFERGLCLPSGSALSQEDLDKIAAVVRGQCRANSVRRRSHPGGLPVVHRSPGNENGTCESVEPAVPREQDRVLPAVRSGTKSPSAASAGQNGGWVTQALRQQDISSPEVQQILAGLPSREAVHLDQAVVEHFLTDKCVMVTGAGGSIGLDLARQVMRYAPSRLLLVERAEPALFAAELALRRVRPDLPIKALLADVGDEPRMRSIC